MSILQKRLHKATYKNNGTDKFLMLHDGLIATLTVSNMHPSSSLSSRFSVLNGFSLHDTLCFGSIYGCFLVGSG